MLVSVQKKVCFFTLTFNGSVKAINAFTLIWEGYSRRGFVPSIETVAANQSYSMILPGYGHVCLVRGEAGDKNVFIVTFVKGRIGSLLSHIFDIN